jgi:hypothetical protein
MTSLRTLFLVMAFALSSIVASAQDVIYVRVGGDDVINDGSTEALAKATINGALGVAEEGDIIDVGAGEFAGTQINVNVTIRGINFGAPIATWGAATTTITSSFSLDNPAGGGRTATFDALYFGPGITPMDAATSTSTNAVVTFTNCHFDGANAITTTGLAWAELIISESTLDGDGTKANAVTASGLTTFNIRESYVSNYTGTAISASGALGTVKVEYCEFSNDNSSASGATGVNDGALKIDVSSLTGSVVVKKNLFTANNNSVVFAGALAGKNVAVQYNRMTANNGYFAIKNTGTGALPASCNAYGANIVPGAVPALLSGSIEAGPYNQIGADQNGAAVGFETTELLACTTSGPIRSSTTEGAGKSYFRIQDAVDASANNATVKVQVGTYPNNVSLDKNVTIIGAYPENWGTPNQQSAVTKGKNTDVYSNIVGTITVKSTVDNATLSALHITSPTATQLISNNALVSLTIDGCWLEVDPTNTVASVPATGAIHNIRTADFTCTNTFVSRPVSTVGQQQQYINAVSFASGNGSRICDIDACKLEGTILIAGMSGLSDVQVTNSTIVDAGTDGFSHVGNNVRTLTFSNNTVGSPRQHGVGFRGRATIGSTYATISNNYFSGAGAADGSASYAAIFVASTTYGTGTHSYTDNHIGAQTGSSLGILNQRTDLTPIATCNWWGSSSDDNITALASGQLTTSPFRVAGSGYNAQTAGFAATGACTGYAFTLALTPTHILCKQANTGEIAVTSTTVAPGNVPQTFTYSWTGPNSFTSTNEDLTALYAGSYTVTATTNGGATKVRGVNITEPATNVSFTFAKKAYLTADMSCTNANDAEITFTAQGGTTTALKPYEYSINNGSSYSTNAVFSSLSVGTYTLVVRDGNGCVTATQTAVVTTPTTPSFTFEKTQYTGQDLRCATSTDGEVTITASNGTVTAQAPYTYSINGGAFGTSNKFSNLAAGTYTLRVKDGNGCDATVQDVVFTAPQALVASASKTNYNGADMNCSTSNDGHITTSYSGGSGTITYAWETSADGSTNWTSYSGTASSISNLSPGYYRVTMTDANSCQSTSSVVRIQAPTVPTFTTSKKSYNGADLSCHNSSNGEITVTASNGTATPSAPYTYSINGGGYGTNNVFANLAAGSYTIDVKDGNGCSATQAQVVIVAPTQLAVSLTKTSYNGADMTCSTSNDGVITSTVTGGTGTMTYAWQKSPDTEDWTSYGGNTSSISNLSPGYYRVTVTDQNNCSKVSSNVRIVAPSVPTFTFAKTQYTGKDLRCATSSDGEVTITASNGTTDADSPYTYSIDGMNYVASNVFSNLAAGTYTLRVKDGNGCSATAQDVVFTAPQALVANVSKTNYNGADMNCSTSNDGQITTSYSGGSGTITYAWETSADGSTNWTPYSGTASSISNLSPGYYRVTMTDANSCQSTSSSVRIQAPTVPTFIATKKSYTGADLSCHNSSDGEITVTASNGTATPSAPYTYSINGGGYGTNNVFTNLVAGSYTIDVKDGNGCSATQAQVVIVAPTQLAVSLTKTSYNGADMTCSTTSDGVITSTVTGGTGTKTYAWEKSPNGVDSWTSHGGNTTSISTLSPGYYRVTVTDQNNCAKVSSNTQIVAPSVPTFTFAKTQYTGKDLRCATSSDGEVTITASNGTTDADSPYTYSIDGTNYVASNVFSNLAAGTYTLRVKDGNGCSATAQDVVFTAPQALVANIGKTNYNGADMNCSTSNDGQIFTSYDGGSGAITYAWQTSADGSTNWTSYSGTASSISNLSPGYYRVTMTDANSCQSTSSSVRIQAPTVPTFTFVKTQYTGKDLRCHNSSDGEVTITASNGTATPSAPYTYSINGTNYGTSNVFSNLAAGSYTLYVKDGNQCAATSQQVVFVAPTELTVSLSKASYNGSDMNCATSDDGSISSNVAGGSGTMSYAWQMSANGTSNWTSLNSNTSSVSNLAPGYYRVTVTDQNSCAKTSSNMQIVAPAAIAISSASVTSNYAGSQIKCNGESNGEITVSANGGTGTLIYSIAGSATTNTTGVFSGLAAGTYAVTATDVNGCFLKSSTITISQPAPIVFTTATNSQNVTCFNGSNGEVTVVTTGGTGTITYALSAGGSNTTGVFGGLVAGTYTVTATDANACSNTSGLITVTQPTELQITSASITSNHNGSKISCNGASDGTITVVATGGVEPRVYSITGSATTNTTGVFSGLTAGTYKVTVTDDHACYKTTSVIDITQPAAVSITSATVTSNYSGRMIRCNGDANGQITAAASGGTGALTYSITGSATTNANGVFSNLAAGTYKITATDLNGCNATSTVVSITQPDPVQITSATVTSNHAGRMISCFGASDGQITAAASGGTGTITFSITGSATTNTTGVFSNLVAGTYQITATDINTCAATSTVVSISQPNALLIATASVTSNHNGRMISCNGASDGQITVTTTGGTGTITYQISGSGASNTSGVFGSLTAGNYTVTATDVNNCSTTTSSISITEPAVLVATGTVTSNYGGSQLSSNVATDGKINVTQIGGTSAYQYKLLGSLNQAYDAYGTNSEFTGLGAGTYTAWVKDANGCEDDAQVVITAPAAMTSSASITSDFNGAHISCHNSSNGVVTVTANGGTQPYTYKQTIPSVGTYTSNNVFTGLSAGSYEFTSKDVNGNESPSTVVIVAPAQLLITSTPKKTYNGRDLSCDGASDGEVTINVSGGTGSKQYSINNGSSYSTNNKFTGLAAGTYAIKVLDANLCDVTGSVTIANPPALSVASVSKSNFNSFNVSCNGSTNGSITVSSNGGGTAPYEYSITGASGTVAYQSSAVFSGLAAGTYNVYVKDVNGCTSPAFPTELVQPTVVTSNPVVTSNFAGSQIKCFGTSDGAVTAVPGGGTSVYTYAWERNNGGSWTAIGTTEAMSDLAAGSYRVTVTDQNGCFATGSVEITSPESAFVDFSTTAKEYVGFKNISCFGASDGEITVVGGGGTGATYYYSVNSTSTWQSSNIFTGLAAGTYQMRVKDVNDCQSAPYQVVLTQPNALTLTVSNTGPINTGNAVSFIVQTSGGTFKSEEQPRYEYSWSSTAGPAYKPTYVGESEAGGLVTSTFTFTDATDLYNGTYTVSVADANACPKSATSQLIVYPQTIFVSTSGDDEFGDGRSINPLRTIQKANDVAIALDVIEVMGTGTAYDESPVITKELTVNAYAIGTTLPTLETGRYFIYGTTNGTTSPIIFEAEWPSSVWNNVGVNSDGSIATALGKVNGGANSTLWIVGSGHTTAGLTISKQLQIYGATTAAAVPTYDGCSIAPPAVITHVPGSVTDKNLFTMTGSTTKALRDLELRIPNASFFVEIANGSSGDVTSSENIVYKWENVALSGTYRRLFGVTNTNYSGGTQKFDVAKLINDGAESTSGYGSGRVRFNDNGTLPVNEVVVGWKAEDAESSLDADNFLIDKLAPMSTTTPKLTGPSFSTNRAKLRTTLSMFNDKYCMSFNGTTAYLDGASNTGINSGTQKTIFVVFAPNFGLSSAAAQVIYKHGDHRRGMSIVQLTDGRISLNVYNDDDDTPGALTHETWIYDQPTDGQPLIAQIYFNGNSTTNRVGAALDKASEKLVEINHGTAPPGYLGDGDFNPTELTTSATFNVANSVSLGARAGSYYFGGWNATNNTVTNNSLNSSLGRGLFFKGHIAEAIMINTASEVKRDAVYCYLRNKYFSGNQNVGNGLNKDGEAIAGEDRSGEATAIVYPNPASSEVSLEVAIPFGGMAQVTIKDALGRTVATVFDGPVSDNTMLSLQADVRNLNTGAYFVNVAGAGGVNATTPLMIQR